MMWLAYQKLRRGGVSFSIRYIWFGKALPLTIMFIVDEKANKWAVEDVSEATAGATTNSVAQIVSGNGRVWALIQKF